MARIVEFSEQSEHDFELVFDHLFSSYIGFGEDDRDAFDKAALRIEEIRSAASDISKAPFRGTLRESIAPGLRNGTIDRAIFWFDLDESECKVRILAVFYGGQDHIRHMLARLLGGQTP